MPDADPTAHQFWLTAYGEIEHYRHDCDISTDTALGPCPDRDTLQRCHYDHVVSRLRAATGYLAPAPELPTDRHLDLSR